MTIVASLDYTPSLQERQVFTGMTILDGAITNDEPISTHDLAERILSEAAECELEVEEFV